METEYRNLVSQIKSIQTAVSQKGFTQEEFDSSVHDILENLKSTKAHNGASSKLMLFLKTIVVILFSFTVLYALWCLDCDCGLGLSEKLNTVYHWGVLNHGYTLQRWLRCLFLPIQPLLLQFVGSYDNICFIQNPLYKDTSTDICTNCTGISKVTNHLNAGTLAPIILQGKGQKQCFEDLRTFYEEYSQTLDQGMTTIKSSNASIHMLKDLFSLDTKAAMMKDDQSYHQWVSRHFKDSHMMRKLFPRPSFLSTMAELEIEKMVSIDAPDKTKYQEDLTHLFGDTEVLYLQSCGLKELKFRPLEKCSTQCISLPSIILGATDFVIWDSALWNPEFHPVAGTQEISIAVFGAIASR